MSAANSFVIDDAGLVTLDPRTLVGTRALVCASSGLGKSYLVRKIIEGIGHEIPFIALDREGEFATLRERFDIVIVGEDGEMPCSIATAPKLARKLIELRVSAVIDLSALPMGDKRKFVRMFLEALIDLPRELWHPTIIVVDEADQFAPEGGDSESTRAVVALMAMGRKRGFCGILATQRLAKLSLDARAEARNVFVGGFTSDVDVKRAADLLGMSTRECASTIRRSKAGQFFALGPAIRSATLEEQGFVRFQCGRVETTHPDPEHRHSIKPPQPSKRIRAVLPEFADLQVQAEREASEIEKLHRDREAESETVRRLTREIADLRRRGGDVPAEERERIAAKARQSGHAEAIASVHGELRKIVDALDRYCNGLTWRTGETSGDPPPAPEVSRRVTKHVHSDATAVLPEIRDVRPGRSSRASAAPGKLGGGGERNMLVALQQHGPLDRRSLGIRCLLSWTGGTFLKYLGNHKAAGRVSEDDAVQITDAGTMALGEWSHLPRGRALVEAWAARLGGGAERRMFLGVVAAGKNGITHAELGRVADVSATGGTFAKYLGNMAGPSSPMLVDRVGAKIVAHPAFLEK